MEKKSDTGTKLLTHTNDAMKTWTIDDIISHLGSFGRFQKIIYFLVVSTVIFNALDTMIVVFVSADQDFRCAVPNLSNDTYKFQNEFHQSLVNDSIPYRIKQGQVVYSQCTVYGNDSHSNSSENEKTCNEWVFDKSVFQSSLISDMNLVCGQSMYRSHAAMLYFGGVLFGSFVAGAISDLFGRKPTMCMALMLTCAGNFATIWIQHITGYFVLRFLCGLASCAHWNSAVVIGLELVDPSKRTFAGIVIELVYCFGEAVLVLLAYLIRDWRTLQLAISIPMIIPLTYCWFLPESTRWLIANGKIEKATKILKTVAKFNKTQLPNIDICVHNRKWNKLQFVCKILHPALLCRLLINICIWTVLALGYYGLTLNTGKIGGDVYINFLVSVVVEAIGYTACLLLMNRIGRRKILAASLILGGSACLCTIFTVLYTDNSLLWLTILLSMVGKCGVSAAFAIVYIYTPELFPTRTRGLTLGVTNSVARIGAMVSPYISNLAKHIPGIFSRVLPLIVIGALMTLAGVSALFLPETLNKELPDTVEDAVNIGKKTSNCSLQQEEMKTIEKA